MISEYFTSNALIGVCALSHEDATGVVRLSRARSSPWPSNSGFKTIHAYVEIEEMYVAETLATEAGGIYFGMLHRGYHADLARGSVELKNPIGNAPDFWWTSSFNAARKAGNGGAPSKNLGAPASPICVARQREVQVGHLLTYDPRNIKAGKDEIAVITTVRMVPVTNIEYSPILAGSAFIKAARFDYLKMPAITDLKSIRAKTDKPFRDLCLDTIGAYDYLASAAHYSRAQRRMSGLMKQNLKFGAKEAAVKWSWLIECAGQPFAFVFVFWKAKRSPISTDFKLSFENPMFGIGRVCIARTIENDKKYLAEFATDVAWVLSIPLEELDQTTSHHSTSNVC